MLVGEGAHLWLGFFQDNHCSKSKCCLLKLPSSLPSGAVRLMVRKVEGCESFQLHLQHQDTKKTPGLATYWNAFFSRWGWNPWDFNFTCCHHMISSFRKKPFLWSSWEVAMLFLLFLHTLPSMWYSQLALAVARKIRSIILMCILPFCSSH